MWDFATDQDYQADLDWAGEFVRNEVEPLEFVIPNIYDVSDPLRQELIIPLQRRVRDRGLWATHLGPELGGQGHGQVKLALLNEILGRSNWAPNVFGCQAPDSGNAEILAHYGTEEQKRRYLRPLLDGDIVSCFSMTEPQGGADPREFRCRAVADGDQWVINGEKYFSSHADLAEFLIAMVITNPDVAVHQGASMFLIPREAEGLTIARSPGLGGEPLGHGHHAYIRYEDVRVPRENLLGGEGQGFLIAQTRLGGGRIHHAMRTVAQLRRAFDMMCERALSREVRGGKLASLQMVQEKIADSWIEIEQFRLLVLRTAWLIDRYKDYKKVRKDIAAVKVAMPKIYHDVVQRAMHVHGALGVSSELPFSRMLLAAEVMGIADGPTEVHKVTVAKQVLRDHKGVDGLWPSGHLPTKRAAARERFAHLLEQEIGNL